MKWPLLVIGFLSACGGCALNKPSITYERLLQYDGFTFCYNNRGYSFIDGALPAIELIDTRAHEEAHRAQVRRFGNCLSWSTYISTPYGNLESETEAYGAGLCTSIQNGADRDSLLENYARRIARGRIGLSYGVALDSARVGLRRHSCG